MKRHKIRILEDLINGETLISSDIFASNTNQYFASIKNHGIQLDEVKDLTKGQHLYRSLTQTPENIEKARAYLNRLTGIKAVAR